MWEALYNILLEKFTDPAFGQSVWIEKEYLRRSGSIPVFLDFDEYGQVTSVNFERKLPALSEITSESIFRKRRTWKKLISKPLPKRPDFDTKFDMRGKNVNKKMSSLRRNLIREGLSGSMFEEELLEDLDKKDS